MTNCAISGCAEPALEEQVSVTVAIRVSAGDTVSVRLPLCTDHRKAVIGVQGPFSIQKEKA